MFYLTQSSFSPIIITLNSFLVKPNMNIFRPMIYSIIGNLTRNGCIINMEWKFQKSYE
jgi:hypothetical protein